MVVIIVTAVPIGLRGQLTKWLLEAAPGVFVGHVSKRVRDLLWERVEEYLGTGRALMVWQTNNEQGLDFKNLGHDWAPTDFDGLTLMMRPTNKSVIGLENPKKGWSKHSRRRRYGN
ncbi:type I-E CRISPR-associated endoribonuclease Cas2e [Jonesiaceae bacterium BS-20]|uniref:Type I-E CRISPR-associated endoribonuclease Cas2e n=1 Tax=Jonesiaceae bacterium BS-20 TaxID=3120821 RepID=A0AAU7DUR8_9MICO